MRQPVNGHHSAGGQLVVASPAFSHAWEALQQLRTVDRQELVDHAESWSALLFQCTALERDMLLREARAVFPVDKKTWRDELGRLKQLKQEAQQLVPGGDGEERPTQTDMGNA